MMQPISGDMSMAPIITAVEFIFNPMDAIKIASTRITRFVPLTTPALNILSSISSYDAVSPWILKALFNTSLDFSRSISFLLSSSV